MRLVTRLDLATHGSILAQTVHAAFEFALEHREDTEKWNADSNYVVCLSVNSEKELLDLSERLSAHDVKHTLFREPDLDNQATSICIQPSDEARKLCSNLPLTFKQRLLSSTGQSGGF